MRHKINFTISIETNDLDHKTYMELQQPLYEKIVGNEIIPMSFEEINEILELKKRKFYVIGIEFPFRNITANDDNFKIKNTNIEIKA